MRVRIQTLPPLPALKAWITTEAIDSIKDLKTYLFNSIDLGGVLKLTLELDGFELLDSSTCVHVLRENDLIIVKQAIGPKRLQAEIPRPAKRVKMTPASPPRSSSSSSGSDSDSSDSALSNDSSDSKANSSSDSDDSSSSSSSVPQVLSSRMPIPPFPPYYGFQSPKPQPVEKAKIVNQRPVPPGMGSSATHERNARRRKKRAMEKGKLANGSSTPLPIPSTSSAPLPTKVSYTQRIPFSISANLHNKNKRKHFMDGPAAHRIQFDDSASAMASNAANGVPIDSGQDTPTNHRTTPPSEQKNLPTNIIVTSVDVESGYWSTQREEEPGRNQRRDVYQDVDTGDIRLDYGDNQDQPNFEEIEAQFNNLPLLEKETYYLPSTLFAFKELDIDPVTLTPQEILKLARLEKQEGIQCELKLIKRSSAKVAFGGGEDEEMDEDDSNLTMELSMMRDGDWRVVA